MAAATKLYKDENERRSEIHPLLEELIDCTFEAYESENGARIDDVCLVDKFCPLMAEYKNEIGTGGTDTSVQIAFGHAKWAAQKRV